MSYRGQLTGFKAGQQSALFLPERVPLNTEPGEKKNNNGLGNTEIMQKKEMKIYMCSL